MHSQNHWQLFNIDSLIEELKGEVPDGRVLDLYVASLAFKNFDFVKRRLPFVIESVTYNASVWQKLVRAAPLKFHIRDRGEGVLVFAQTDHCGCLRTYRLKNQRVSTCSKIVTEGWVTLPTTQSLYDQIDTPAARSVHDAWHAWMTQTTQEPTALAEGRFENTSVTHSMIFSGIGSCLACKAPPIASARTTLGTTDRGLLIQLPLCAAHLESARQQPSVLRFFEILFSVSLNIPDVERAEAIPDELIPPIHTLVAEGLDGEVGKVEKRRRGWQLTIQLTEGWCWLLRLNTLMDYAYMLYQPGISKEVYRADSAPHHPDLAFFPDHEHSRPYKKSDTTAPSFLYGNPIFDLKRLREVERELRKS
ncbi:toxin-antitoxin system TumE family protein [Pseudomonas fragariae (ex Marin et al. 2024)]|uniref:toxin-antitoxin system TumE family protein n=1 Tax=Pseudomonas TaxID=286 RepID=UPI001F0D9877|nr:DUF6516 family protein [Pseudomonas syringae]MCH5509125.1 DUF6516 family protein [Pseudomonas syringae pv. syringae]MCH5639170.1 DUF6516 family protein [Pseudomonas syringae pv. syringae]MCH7428359.1 DUF6516 family protein [Pseudomonas syringae pv. syringae]